jgi:hypothetical protein
VPQEARPGRQAKEGGVVSDARIDSYHGEERRKAPRIPLCLVAAAECDAWMGMCYTKDISQSGAFVISQKIPSVNTGFTLVMRLPGGLGRLKIRGVAVRVQGDYPRGFGLRWKDLSADEQDILLKVREKWDLAFGGGQA